MLLINPNDPSTTGDTTAVTQIIESRHEGAQTFAGMSVIPTTSGAASIILRYEGARKMPSRDKLAEAMRRMAASAETDDQKAARLAKSFADDTNDLYTVGK